MSHYVAPLVALFLIVIICFVIASKWAGTRTLPVHARRLMTSREREAILLIEGAVPKCRVHAQVAMGALIECNRGLTRAQRTAVRNRFDRKVIDFVLEDRSTGDVVALVELDDRSHDERKDRARDAITRAAGYRTIRLVGGKHLDRDAIRTRILGELSQSEVITVAAAH